MPQVLRSAHVPSSAPVAASQALKGYRPHWSGPTGSAGSLRYGAVRALWLAGLAGAALLLRAAAFLL
ncbi:hypothetical protein [Aquabacter cavernae]|uniref:hypothetical protein n=1 Tax=Aquabacter cavernae TaxID=2496029 RepID=UPI000F8C64D8|nr:hypothetical protein [Aquabacter cavernae]